MGVGLLSLSSLTLSLFCFIPFKFLSMHHWAITLSNFQLLYCKKKQLICLIFIYLFIFIDLFLIVGLVVKLTSCSSIVACPGLPLSLQILIGLAYHLWMSNQRTRTVHILTRDISPHLILFMQFSLYFLFTIRSVFYV